MSSIKSCKMKTERPPVGNNGGEAVVYQVIDSPLIFLEEGLCFPHQQIPLSYRELLKWPELCEVWRQVGFSEAQVALNVQHLHVQGSCQEGSLATPCAKSSIDDACAAGISCSNLPTAPKLSSA